MTQASNKILQTLKSDILTARWHEQASAALEDGQVRMRIEQFSFTANNATYAAFGDAMKYWDFFPQIDSAWGCVPVWGFATVIESRCSSVPIGSRFYGYYPFATELIVQPDKVTPNGFTDGTAHRSHLHAVYNQYQNLANDPSYKPELEPWIALLKPLFITSFLIDDFFADNAFFGATHLILSSASSKTAYGTAYCLAQRAPGRPKVIGLTSAGNLDFTRSLGVYDEVLSYDQVSALDANQPSAYIDFSGSSGARAAVHNRCQGLTYSCAIGGTHWHDLKAGHALSGPKPVMFFAPAQIKKRLGDWGAQELNQRLGQALARFIAKVQTPGAAWMTVQTHSGPQAASAVYGQVVRGTAAADIGLMISFND